MPLASFLSWRTLAVWAVAYGLLWSIVPPLLSSSFPLDVAESLSWGREWQWGNYKHPPLAPWVLHSFYWAFGKAGPFLLSQLCIAATLWLVWRSALRLMERDRALLAALLTMAVVYYTRPALEFNHNIAQMPIWAGLGHSLLVALQEGRKRDWLLWGLWAGVGMLTKYSVAILLLVQGGYLLIAQRQVLRQPGPWLAVLLGLAVFAPHFVWLIQNDWLPLTYASSRASSQPTRAALEFLLTQLLNHLPLLLIAGITAWRVRNSGPGGWRWHTALPGYVLTMALGSGLLVTVLGLVLGLGVHDMWGMPMWSFSGLLLMALWPQAQLHAANRPLLKGLAVWLVLISVLTGAFLAYGAQWRQRPARTDWPQAALAAQAYATWDTLSTCPLDVVAGDYWLTALVTTARVPGPSVLINHDPRFSPWVSAERLQKNGVLWLWQDGEHPTPPAPMEALPPPETAAPQWHSGQWALAWPFNNAPWVLHWRAYVPEGCARSP